MNSGTSNGNYHQITNNLTIYPALNIYYYISPQMRIQLASSFNINQSSSASKYDNGDPDTKATMHRYHHNISIHFIYSFF